MTEKSLAQDPTPEEVAAFRREFQSRILKAFLDNPPEPEPLMPWESDEPQEPEQK